MKNNTYFKTHPVYNNLPYHFIVGLIQLFTDEGIISAEEKKGYYVNFIDFRERARSMYKSMSDTQKDEYIEFFKFKGYLDSPPPTTTFFP